MPIKTPHLSLGVCISIPALSQIPVFLLRHLLGNSRRRLPATCRRDPSWVTSSKLRPGPDPVIVGVWEVNQWKAELFPSLLFQRVKERKKSCCWPGCSQRLLDLLHLETTDVPLARNLPQLSLQEEKKKRRNVRNS